MTLSTSLCVVILFSLEHSTAFEVKCSKDILTVSNGCLESVSRVIQRCSKGVSRVF